MKEKLILLSLLTLSVSFIPGDTSAQTSQNLMSESANPILSNLKWDIIDVVITSGFVSDNNSAYYIYTFENKSKKEILISIESIFPGILRLAPNKSETMLFVCQSVLKPATLAVAVNIFAVSGENKLDFKNTAGLFFPEGLLSWLSDGFYERYYGDKINIYMQADSLK